MFLDSTLRKLQIVLTAARTTLDMPVLVDWVDITSTTTTPGLTPTNTNGTTVVDILPAPAASTQRKVNGITVYNKDTGPCTATVSLMDNTTNYPILTTTLGIGETLGFTDTQGWYVQDANGNRKTAASNLYTSTTSNLLGTASSKLPTIAATQSGGALTFSLTALYLDFHNATITSGTPSTILASPTNLVLPSGGTLNFTTTVQGRMALAVMDNAGTAELAVASTAGGLSMNEEGLISTTAISASSTAANVWYSTTARTNLPYKIVGAVDVVNTAGAWGNPVAVVNGIPNNLGSFGTNQIWSNVTASRAQNTTYYNITNNTIYVLGSLQETSPANVSIQLDGNTVQTLTSTYTTTAFTDFSFPVRAGGSYLVNPGGLNFTLSSWWELR